MHSCWTYCCPQKTASDCLYDAQKSLAINWQALCIVYLSNTRVSDHSYTYPASSGYHTNWQTHCMYTVVGNLMRTSPGSCWKVKYLNTHVKESLLHAWNTYRVQNHSSWILCLSETCRILSRITEVLVDWWIKIACFLLEVHGLISDFTSLFASLQVSGQLGVFLDSNNSPQGSAPIHANTLRWECITLTLNFASLTSHNLRGSSRGPGSFFDIYACPICFWMAACLDRLASPLCAQVWRECGWSRRGWRSRALSHVHRFGWRLPACPGGQLVNPTYFHRPYFHHLFSPWQPFAMPTAQLSALPFHIKGCSHGLPTHPCYWCKLCAHVRNL